ncbi:serine/threonine protein kinase [Microcoleus sp. FACHB-1515]|uniref:serine/threonine protein kinase n=1 Tax=Cyanophyceae TaxID=3028117 RepID=UPI0016872E95|nr:serine/threonine-protein kinase [Microcoleus sp. FACHB-1515]MBD2092636.1 serine/threonine protein kinase [Microcoleus sp. FACHB-1515]
MDQFINSVFHDRYQVQSLLGRKTGRRTFLAIDLETDSIVVLKLLLFAPDFTWEDLKLFEREAETLKSLDHPAIPKYLDYFETDTELGKGFALVQSYIEARSLQQWTQSGRTFSEVDLREIAKQLLAILAYLHDRNPPIIHRDIKPSNVLLGDRSGNSVGPIYLVDFGSVQTVAHGGTVTVVGTYGYMPPEQFGGRSLPASDLFSLGATLIYLATGQHPADLPQADLRIEFEKSANLSKSFSQWIHYLIEPSLSKRATSVQEAIDRLQKPQQNQRFSLLRRPTSDIQLQATPTTLEILIPKDQIQFQSQSSTSLIWLYSSLAIAAVLMATGLMITVLSIVIFILLLVVFPVLALVSVFFWLVARLFPSSEIAQTQIAPRQVKFELQNGSAFVSLAFDDSEKLLLIPRQKLRSITVDSYRLPHYRLNVECQAENGQRHKLQIMGDRSEIQWLCDELIEWGDFKIEYREASGV